MPTTGGLSRSSPFQIPSEAHFYYYPLVITHIANWKMAIEIVDLPMKIVIFHSYVSLPEGRYIWIL